VLEEKPSSEYKRLAKVKISSIYYLKYLTNLHLTYHIIFCLITFKYYRIPIRLFKPEKGESWFDLFKRCKEILDCFILKYVKLDYILPKVIEKEFSNIIPNKGKNINSEKKTEFFSKKDEHNNLIKVEPEVIKILPKRDIVNVTNYRPTFKKTVVVEKDNGSNKNQIGKMIKVETSEAIHKSGGEIITPEISNLNKQESINKNDLSSSMYRSPTVIVIIIT